MFEMNLVAKIWYLFYFPVIGEESSGTLFSDVEVGATFLSFIFLLVFFFFCICFLFFVFFLAPIWQLMLENMTLKEN